MDEELTRELAYYNQRRLVPGDSVDPHPDELGYIEQFRKRIAAAVPPWADYAWYCGLLTEGPGQQDPLFPWLAEKAPAEALRWFLQQEAAGEAGFGDLVALTQVKMPDGAKLEMARNYWDEMGRGDARGMHHRLLEAIVAHLGIQATIDTTVEEALALNNVMMALACHRRYAWQAVGALGVIEMTAPGRVAKVNQGLARIGVPAEARRYFSLHATLDIKHSQDWNEEVVRPLAQGPGGADRMRAIAEGAYLRLWCGHRCFERYRAFLEVGESGVGSL